MVTLNIMPTASRVGVLDNEYCLDLSDPLPDVGGKLNHLGTPDDFHAAGNIGADSNIEC